MLYDFTTFVEANDIYDMELIYQQLLSYLI